MTDNQLYELVKDIGIPFITLVLGVYLGQRSNLHLAKRTEFNALAKEIYFSLKNQIKSSPLNSVALKADEIALYIPFWKKIFFNIHVKEYSRYYNITGTYDPETSTVIENKEAIAAQIRAAKKLLHYYKPK